MSIPRFSLSHFNKVSSRRLWTFIMAYHASHRNRVDGARQPHRSINKHSRLTTRRTRTVLQCLLLFALVVWYSSLYYSLNTLCSPPKFHLWFLLFIVDWYDRRQATQAPGNLQQTWRKSIPFSIQLFVSNARFAVALIHCRQRSSKRTGYNMKR
jgi:hypothetical protein